MRFTRFSLEAHKHAFTGLLPSQQYDYIDGEGEVVKGRFGGRRDGASRRLAWQNDLQIASKKGRQNGFVVQKKFCIIFAKSNLTQ